MAEKTISVQTTTTVNITLTEEEVTRIILKHLQLNTGLVEFNCGHEFLRSVVVTTIETTSSGQNLGDINV